MKNTQLIKLHWKQVCGCGWSLETVWSLFSEMFTFLFSFTTLIELKSSWQVLRVCLSHEMSILPGGRIHQPARPVALPPGWSWTGTRNPCGRWTIYTLRPRGKTVNPPRYSVPHPPRSYTLLQWKVYVLLQKCGTCCCKVRSGWKACIASKGQHFFKVWKLEDVSSLTLLHQ